MRKSRKMTRLETIYHLKEMIKDWEKILIPLSIWQKEKLIAMKRAVKLLSKK